MKVISLLQPWATLVVMGIKQIETRNWATGYRGPLLIHASKGKSGKLIAQNASITTHIPDFTALPFGMIIGEVKLVDVIPTSQLQMPAGLLADLTLEEQAFGAYAGKWCWMLEEAVMLDELIHATGRLGLWEI